MRRRGGPKTRKWIASDPLRTACFPASDTRNRVRGGAPARRMPAGRSTSVKLWYLAGGRQSLVQPRGNPGYQAAKTIARGCKRRRDPTSCMLPDLSEIFGEFSGISLKISTVFEIPVNTFHANKTPLVYFHCLNLQKPPGLCGFGCDCLILATPRRFDDDIPATSPLPLPAPKPPPLPAVYPPV